MITLATAIVLYVLGYSQAYDAYLDTLEHEGVPPDTTAKKLALVFTVACWPFIELHHLIFERGDTQHGRE